MSKTTVLLKGVLLLLFLIVVFLFSLLSEAVIFLKTEISSCVHGSVELLTISFLVFFLTYFPL